MMRVRSCLSGANQIEKLEHLARESSIMSCHRSFLVLITATIGLAAVFIPQAAELRGAEWKLVWNDEFDGDAAV